MHCTLEMGDEMMGLNVLGVTLAKKASVVPKGPAANEFWGAEPQRQGEMRDQYFCSFLENSIHEKCCPRLKKSDWRGNEAIGTNHGQDCRGSQLR